MHNSWDRRSVIGAGLAAGGLLATGAGAATLSTSTLPVAPYVEARTTKGRIRGGTARGALCFKGIPYAGPVSGAGRFKAPPEMAPWTGVRDALTLGAPTLQKAKQTYGEQEPAYSEDCLFLNVWTPAIDNRARPVMVYLHGGGYAHGSGGSPTQDGGRLAAVHDVVVVALNHRLGLLGFLWLGDVLGENYATSGNQSMFDIIAALRWVHDNIAEFGGDPGNVTILGESGGGGKVGTLMGMPEAKGLFHKAGISSGAQLNRMPRAAAAETTRRLMRGLGLSDARKLLEVPADVLLKLQWDGEVGKGPLSVASEGYKALPLPNLKGISFSESAVAGHFGPVVDGWGLPADPFDPVATPITANIPLMIGHNRNESSFFFIDQPAVFDLSDGALVTRLAANFGDRTGTVLDTYRRLYPSASPTELFLLIDTARTMGFETTVLAERKAIQPAPVYVYRWDYVSNRPIDGTKATLGPGHASDIGPMFDNWDAAGLHGNGPGVEAASHNLSGLWTGFARTGRPAVAGAPEWPRYDSVTRPTMVIDTTCRVVSDPDGAARKMWESFV